MAKLDLLFVYKFCTKGGVEVVLRNRLEALKNNFKDVHADVIFFADYGGRVLFSGDLANHVFFLSKPSEIRKFILERNYEYVISIDTPELYDMIKDLDVRVVLEVHTHYDDNRRYLMSILNKKPATAAITVPSDYFKGIVTKETGGKVPIYTFHNFIGMEYYEQSGFHKPDEAGHKYKAIGWVGRLDFLKNWREFLQIARAILDDRSDVQFVIVGDTADENEKKAFIAGLKNYDLLPYVKWLPFYMHMPYFYNYLASTGGCFVSTSRGESFGMTILESMSCKCPVVCSNIRAYSELLCSGAYGMLYRLGEVNEASSKVQHVLDDVKYREDTVTNAYRHVQNDYCPRTILADWIDFLQKLKDDKGLR